MAVTEDQDTECGLNVSFRSNRVRGKAGRSPSSDQCEVNDVPAVRDGMNREMNREMRRGVWKYIPSHNNKGLLPGSLGLELEAVQAQTDPNLSLEMNCAQALGCEFASTGRRANGAKPPTGALSQVPPVRIT